MGLPFYVAERQDLCNTGPVTASPIVLVLIA